MCILLVISKKALYGYNIIQRLHVFSGNDREHLLCEVAEKRYDDRLPMTGKNIGFYLLIMLKYGIISRYNRQYFLRKEVEDHAISYNY